MEQPTGWLNVDRQIHEARDALERADSEEGFQSAGLVWREVLISVAQATYNREKYPPQDEVEPSESDAKRMIEALIAVELAGGNNEEAHAHATAALNLALVLQHDQMADFQTAALCVEATFSVVNIIAILTGRHSTN